MGEKVPVLSKFTTRCVAGVYILARILSPNRGLVCVCKLLFQAIFIKKAGGHPSYHWWIANEESIDASCKRTCRQFLGVRRHTAGMTLKIWTDGKAEVGKEEDQRRKRARRKKMQAREKVEKPRKSARRCGAKHISRFKLTKRFEVELLTKRTPLWREAHFEVKMCKTPQCRITFGS